MGLKIKKKATIPPMEGGTYQAVCVGVVDLGTQYSELFKKYSDKVMFMWEIPSQTVEVDGELKPRWLSKDFSASLHEKSGLYQILVPWRGRQFTPEELEGEGFSITEMLGKNCLLQVIVDTKDDGTSHNKITAVIAPIDGMPTVAPQTAPFAFDTDAWDDKVFEALPEWVQERVKKSTQYQKLHTPTDDVDFKEEAPVTPPVTSPAVTAPPDAGGCPI